MSDISAFRLGDVRGIYPEEIDEGFVNAFAHALVGQYGLDGCIATGRDLRDSSESLQSALNDALKSIGITVLDMGVCPTELGYFASGRKGVSAAVVVTASHNPAQYNGLKCVLSNGEAVTVEHGLKGIEQKMRGGYRHPAARGSIESTDMRTPYLAFLGQRYPEPDLASGRIALHGLNGTAVTMAGLVADSLHIPISWCQDGPGPVPREGADPTNPRIISEMADFMSGEGFALGVAWDGDCDRCVCFDAEGDLIPPYYLLGLLADYFLARQPGGSIVFDTKLCWNTLDVIRRRGGKPIAAKTGHAYMKQKMHESGAVYGGESSSHHYFGEFYGCDSGMLAWLSVLRLLKSIKTPISERVAEQRASVCCTPEISLSLDNVALDEIENSYGKRALAREDDDGFAFTMPGDWRFSVRRSKTEPLVRINFESRGNADALLEEGEALLKALEPYCQQEPDWRQNWRIQ